MAGHAFTEFTHMQMQKKSSSSSTEEVAGCVDILWKILLPLPLKYLIRLKCVSKQWQTLISDQQFRDFHSLHHRPLPTSLIITNKYGPSVSPLLSFTTTTTTPTFGVLDLNFPGLYNFTIVCSCNGFLLCRHPVCNSYYICNPITRDFTYLYSGNHHHPFRRHKIALYLAPDPFISPPYEVISVVEGDSPFCFTYLFNVYSFKTCSWVGWVWFSSPFALKVHDGVCCNRAIHWCNKAEFCMYFDLDTQRLRKWRMPLSDSEWTDKSRRIMYFGESGGCLHLVVGQTIRVYDIFEHKEDYSGWSLKHHVDLSHLSDEFPQGCLINLGYYIVRPAKEDNSMMVLMFFMGLVTHTVLMIYDPVNSRKLFDFKMDKKPHYYAIGSVVFQYLENTALVVA